jgi:hypothetical protein
VSAHFDSRKSNPQGFYFIVKACACHVTWHHRIEIKSRHLIAVNAVFSAMIWGIDRTAGDVASDGREPPYTPQNPFPPYKTPKEAPSLLLPVVEIPHPRFSDIAVGPANISFVRVLCISIRVLIKSKPDTR